MVNISNNGIITIVRGDSVVFETKLNIGTVIYPQFYELKPADKVYFCIAEPNQPFEFAIVKKVLDINNFDPELKTIAINIIPEDTEELVPGVYYYTIKLVKANGLAKPTVSTIINKKKFIILD